MTFDATSSSLRIAIVGTGAMGRGIAQIASQAGITVLMFDALAGAAAKARDALGKTFDTLRQKGRMKDEAVDAAMQRLQPVEGIAQLADAALVIEVSPVVIDCPACGPQQLASTHDFRCPVCGTPCGAVIGGKELEILDVTLDDTCVSEDMVEVSA